MDRPRRLLGLTLALALASTLPALGQTSCGTATHPGGDWPSAGRDPANSRSQPAERSIDPARAAALAPARVFRVASAQMTGAFNNTVAVAEGCIVGATDQGWVFALNADDFTLAWKVRVQGTFAQFGGMLSGSPAVRDGIVYVLVSHADGPYALALRLHDGGSQVWRSEPVESYRNSAGTFSYTNATPVVSGRWLFMGFSAPEGDPQARGGYAIVDTTDGTIAAKRYTIPDDAQGYAGGGIWSTAAVDPATGYAYVGTGNPYTKQREHPNTNAIVKIDLRGDPATNPSFGDIAGTYKGTVDQYQAGLDDQPACALLGDEVVIRVFGHASPLCAQQDLDFGGAVQLFESGGALVAGSLQKSGVYHAAHAGPMTGAWTALAGTPCLFCNGAASAFDHEAVYVAATLPGQLLALDRDSGAVRWVAPLGGPLHYEGVSVAGGVVYVTDMYGMLNAFDAATGTQVLKRPMSADLGAVAASYSSKGIAIARNTVYATANTAPGGGVLLAYR